MLVFCPQLEQKLPSADFPQFLQVIIKVMVRNAKLLNKSDAKQGEI
jgi:hypothetical protein